MSKNSYPKISIIFPTLNGWSDTKKCLKSLSKQDYPDKNIEIVVVDNNSSDQTPKKIRRCYKKTKVLVQKKNLGFAKAVNIGIKHASGEYTLITNSDVTFNKKYLKSMVEVVQSDNKIGIVGGLVFRGNTKTLGFDGLKINPYLGFHQYDLTKLDQVRECDFVSGNGMFIKKSVFKKIGYFDEGFFMYYEDVDFCLRAKKAVFRIIFNPSAISHHGYLKTAVREMHLRQIVELGYKSKWRCIFKNSSMVQIISSLLFQFSIAIIAQNMHSSFETYSSLIKGFCWNLVHLSETLRARKKYYVK